MLLFWYSLELLYYNIYIKDYIPVPLIAHGTSNQTKKHFFFIYLFSILKDMILLHNIIIKV